MNAILRHAVLVHLVLSEQHGWTRSTETLAQRMDADADVLDEALRHLERMGRVTRTRCPEEWTVTAAGWSDVCGVAA